ncbi:MAG: 3-isopropylmalate dehydratase small subunit, partial [Burkholderiales bacterium]|nr:3-isopropylmalate dehydratase small subunit [Burkholderiales bacterium]
MEALQRVSGVAAPFMRINIDTDQIIPALFLGGTDAKGYGAHLFNGWRFLANGTPNPEFILNQAPFDRSEILLADR